MTMHLSLILGGARSGKTRLAEQRAQDSAHNQRSTLVYIATATAEDDEMHQRIARHQQDRDATGQPWLTVEAPLNLSATLSEYAKPGYCLVVDCLTLWLSNCLHHQCWAEQRTAFIEMLRSQQIASPSQTGCPTEIILISNETGLGVVPMGQLSRQFVDESGFLHQELAQLADQVTLVVAGLPTELKNN